MTHARRNEDRTGDREGSSPLTLDWTSSSSSDSDALLKLALGKEVKASQARERGSLG